MNKSELLINLLSSFKSKLTILEHNSKEHLDIIKSTSIMTNSITNLCIIIQRQIKDKEDLNANTKKQLTHSNSKLAQGRISTTSKLNASKIRSKTPLTKRNTIEIKFNIRSNTKAIQDCQSNQSSKPNLLIKSKDIDETNSFCSPIKKTIPHNLSKTDLNNRTGLKNNNLALRSSKASLNSKTSTEFSKGNIPLKKSPTNLKKMAKKKIPIPQKLDESFGKIFTLDPKFMYEKEDPLLIGPISDIDFVSTSMIKHLETPIIAKQVFVSNWITQCNIEDFHEDYLPFISIYLEKKELINLMLVGKTYRKMVKKLLLKDLEIEKGDYESRLTLFPSFIITENESAVTANLLDNSNRSKIQFSKGTLKAVSLLNESLLNKLFVENHLPSKDILLIYYIYFQLIEHKLSKEKRYEIFWKECSQYFLKAPEGKTGSLIHNDMINKTKLSIGNIKILMELVEPNFAKIAPSFFSKMCGTTGLVVFFIKDVLDYIGISIDRKIQGEAYITFKWRLKQVEMKIEKLRKIN